MRVVCQNDYLENLVTCHMSTACRVHRLPLFDPSEVKVNFRRFKTFP